MSVISRLFKIEVKDDAGPLDLYRTWLNDASADNGEFAASSMNLATVSKDGIVSNRTVLIRLHDENGFMFTTSRYGRKHKDIQNHPQVSFCVLWMIKINGETHTRQMRVEGIAEEMPGEFGGGRMRSASLKTKIRYTFSKQGNEIAWEELKTRHEEYVRQHEPTDGVDIAIDDHMVNYKVIPQRVEYYESLMDPITIADRVLFRKDDNGWNSVHLEA